MSFFSIEQVFICRDCGTWWTQEQSLFGTYSENPEHICEICGAQGREASEEEERYLLPEPTDYSDNGSLIEREVIAAEERAETEKEDNDDQDDNDEDQCDFDIDIDADSDADADTDVDVGF